MKQKLLTLLILFFTFLYASTSFSQGVWEQMDIPYSGIIRSLVASPNGTIFAASQTNLFRSTDDGENWEVLAFPGTHFKVAVNPDGDVFAIDNDEIFRSPDNGDTWEVVFSGGPPGFSTITISPEGIIAVGNINWEFGPLIYISTDNGETWETKLEEGYTEQMNLFFNGQGQLFMANSNYLVRSDDLGTTWSEPLMWTGFYFNMIMAFDSNDEIYLANDYETGIFHSTDNGETWERVFNAGARAIAVNSNDQVFAGDLDLFMSPDHGDTWNSIHELNVLTVSSICIDFENTIYAATSNGIFRSFDNGQNWELSYKGLFEPLVTDIETYNQDVYLTRNGKLFHSSDLGINWEEVLLPLRNNYMSSIEIRPNGEIYVYGYYTSFDTYGTILKSSDNGQTWTVLVSRITSDIAFGMGDDIFILSDSLIHRSMDNGINWQILNQDLSCLNPSEIAITNSGVIFVNSSLCEDAVYVSTDNGNTWTEAGYGSMNNVENIEVNSQGDAYILTEASEIFTSSDNGENWTQIEIGHQVNTIELDYLDNLLVGTDNGVYASYDNGATWTQNSEGIEDSDVTSLHVGIMGYAFVGTSNGQLFRQDYNVKTNNQIRNNLTIYPNPAREKFTLVYPWFQAGTVDKVNIFNVYGKLVKTVPFDNINLEVDISGLEAGVYMVTINEGLSKKLIIQ